MAIKFYIKKDQDSLYFGHFLKVVYNRGGWFEALWIKLRKLKILKNWKNIVKDVIISLLNCMKEYRRTDFIPHFLWKGSLQQ